MELSFHFLMLSNILCTHYMPEGITSIILDMDSGQEIVNAEGADFQVFSPSGQYTIAVGNTPFASSFEAYPGTYSGTQKFDLKFNARDLSSGIYFVRLREETSILLKS